MPIERDPLDGVPDNLIASARMPVGNWKIVLSALYQRIADLLPGPEFDLYNETITRLNAEFRDE